MVSDYVDLGSGKDENVIYYRRKNGWITWGDTQASKMRVMQVKGATPLFQYGTITDSKDLWGPILRHPDGPAEFPVEQVLTYRWYRQDQLPDLRPLVQMGGGPIAKFQRVGVQPKIRFPQLAGVKITEFPCPESCNRYFHSPLHLGNHLRVMHDYDRAEIIKYGEAMNIDFSKVPGGRELVEYDFTAAEVAAKEVEEDAEEVFSVESVSAAAPASLETASMYEEKPSKEVTETVACPDCGKEVKAGMGLQLHQARWCKKSAVPA